MTYIIRELTEIFKYLLIPDDNENTRQYARRMLMTTFIIALTFSFVGHYMYAATNFANAADLRDIQIVQTEENIINAKQAQCEIQSQRNQTNAEARKWAVQRLNNYLNKYRDLTGHSYNMPTCDQLVWAKN